MLYQQITRALPAFLMSLFLGCANSAAADPSGGDVVSSTLPLGVAPASELDWRKLPAPDHTLAHFRPGEVGDYCFDRAAQPYTAVVDSHFHPKL